MKAITKQMKRKGPKFPKAPEIPVNTQDSSVRADRMSLALMGALMLAALATLVSGVYFSAMGFSRAIAQVPLDWGQTLFMTLLLTATLLVARSLFWLRFYGTVMLASKLGGWKTAEAVCRRAILLPTFLSRGSSWASVGLVQSLVNRGQYKEAMEVAESEWQRSSGDKRQVQNLGPMCMAVGISSQVQDDMKESLKWNERAIDCLSKSFEELSRPRKGIIDRAMAPQSGQWLDQVRAQLAMAHFNTATIYRSKMDNRRAKENFKKAVDHASCASDFPQKSDILKVCRDQLRELKHA